MVSGGEPRDPGADDADVGGEVAGKGLEAGGFEGAHPWRGGVAGWVGVGGGGLHSRRESGWRTKVRSATWPAALFHCTPCTSGVQIGGNARDARLAGAHGVLFRPEYRVSIDRAVRQAYHESRSRA